VRVHVSAGGGDDVISARIEATGVTAPGDYHFELGAGADVLELVGITTPADAQAGGPVVFHVAAGAGNDTINGLLEHVALISMPLSPPPVAFFDLNEGDDVLNLALIGSVQLSIWAGAGNDVLDLVGVTAPTDNRVNIFASLDAGNDVLNLNSHPDEPTAQIGRLDMSLSILGGSGADIVDLVAITSPENNRINIFANLGAHDDEFGLDVNAAAARSASLSLNVVAGTGNDVVDLAGIVSPGMNVSNVWVNLGSGRDVASVRFLVAAPTLNSPQNSILNVTINGAAGADDIEARVDSLTTQRVNLRGRLRLLGGQGNDHMGLFVDDNIFGLILSLDGGIGGNTHQTQGRVRVMRSR
jgi:hypothetical protein